jgi:hypothetical protein
MEAFVQEVVQALNRFSPPQGQSLKRFFPSLRLASAHDAETKMG